MTGGLSCAFCSKPITEPRRALREMTGWAEPRSQGGTNALKLRKETGRLAHDHCVRIHSYGGTANQGSLL